MIQHLLYVSIQPDYRHTVFMTELMIELLITKRKTKDELHWKSFK
jgi:hypothetical protein